MKKLITLFFILFINISVVAETFDNLNQVQQAFDDSPANANAKYYVYDPYLTYKVRMRLGMTTTFIIPNDSKIEEYALAMSSSILFDIADNSVFDNVLSLTPKSAGIDTSLTIFDNKGRVYTFYLRVDNVNSRHLPHLKVSIQSNPDYPGELTNNTIRSSLSSNNPIPSAISSQSEKAIEYLVDETKTKEEKIDFIKSAERGQTRFDYKYVGGNLETRPTLVFDDGINTYFIFRDSTGKKPMVLPNIYQVVDGVDLPVTARETLSDGIVVVKATANKWSLLLGDSYFCIERGDK